MKPRCVLLSVQTFLLPRAFFIRLCNKLNGHLGSGLHLYNRNANVRWQLKPPWVGGPFLLVATAAAPVFCHNHCTMVHRAHLHHTWRNDGEKQPSTHRCRTRAQQGTGWEPGQLPVAVRGWCTTYHWCAPSASSQVQVSSLQGILIQKRDPKTLPNVHRRIMVPFAGSGQGRGPRATVLTIFLLSQSHDAD